MLQAVEKSENAVKMMGERQSLDNCDRSHCRKEVLPKNDPDLLHAPPIS
jgi:hypothetical protein